MLILKCRSQLIKGEVVNIDIEVKHKKGSLFVHEKDVLVYHVSLKNGETYKLENAAASLKVGDVVEIADFDDGYYTLLSKRTAKTFIQAKRILFGINILAFLPIGFLLHESAPVFKDVGLTVGMAGFYFGVICLAGACFKSLKNIEHLGFSEKEYNRIKEKSKQDQSEEGAFALKMTDINVENKIKRQ